MTTIPQDIFRIYESIGTETQCIRCTDLFNEGWLLRLLLSAAFKSSQFLPFGIEVGARWYSEALLPSPFRPRFRGDRLSEASTNADGVVGQFRFWEGTRAGLQLKTDCTQFVVCEAKMFSKLSKGTKNAVDYNQAARSVGCIAQLLCEAGRPIEEYKSLGFFVFAPECELTHPDFMTKMDREAIRKGIVERVDEYRSETNYRELKFWRDNWVMPLIDAIELGCYSWESILSDLRKANMDEYLTISEFYRSCLIQR